MSHEFLLISSILLLASFTQGFSGFGFQLVALSLLSFLIDLKVAIPLCALFGLIINIYLTISLRKHIKIFELKKIILGSIIGIPPGVFFLSEAEPYLIKLLLGIVLIIFVSLSLTDFIRAKDINVNWGYLFGFFSGILGGAFNTNGPPVLIYFYIQNWDKYKLKASITGFFLFSSVLIVLSHYASGLTNGEVLSGFITYLPFIIAGQIAGKILFGRTSSTVYKKFILGFLFIIGAIMILG
ncbi:MAG: sulfite exporter TauE/SafE family protein [Melioribacteraceae bacterium]|nr:sulfite exporter TauE/SafE family protein [Melioribacteraceae bacterium]